MKAFYSFALASLLALTTPALLAGAPTDDTSAGVWKLNLAKSTFGSRKPPQSEVRTYTVDAMGTRVVISDVNADGSRTESRALLTYDGRAHAFVGSDNYDAVSTKRLSKYETTADMWLKGKVVGSLRRLVSEDGKTMTMNMKLDKADGTQEMTVSVFDKQE